MSKEKENKKLYTHMSVDIDAVASLWLVKRFFPEDFEIVFVPANWDGDGFEVGDMAVDITAGGKGIKGRIDKNGTVHSSFASLLFQCEDKKAQKVLRNLAYLIDHHDAFGGIGKVDRRRKISSFLGLSIVLRALQSYHYNDDETVVSRMFEILDGLYKIELSREGFKKSASERVEVVGKTAILISDGQKNFSSRGLFKKGFQAVIYIDGYNMGLLVPRGVSINQPELIEFIKNSGEFDEWFFHPAGYMMSRGTRKSPVKTSSGIDPYELAKKWEEIRKKL